MHVSGIVDIKILHSFNFYIRLMITLFHLTRGAFLIDEGLCKMLIKKSKLNKVVVTPTPKQNKTEKESKKK